MSNPSESSHSHTPPNADQAEKDVDDALPEADRRLFELLDQYLEHLHDEDITSRSVLIERHPELLELMHCLESLDSLAISPSEADTDPDGVSPKTAEDCGTVQTVIWHGSPSDADEPPNAAPPTNAQKANGTFGKYELLEELGRGGMGVVYRAWQADLKRHVAIKMILHSRLASSEDVRRFTVEAQSAGGLNHANIVRIHEVGQIGGQHFFSMEYIEGDNLADRIQCGPYEADEAASCVAAVARAVHYLHQHGIVHRDLKPSNILLDDESMPHVTDFGLAKVFDGTDSGKTQSGTIVGTPSYMSPEQASGHASKVSPKSDVYSLGAILYELLCGRPPFRRETPLDTLVDVIEGEPTMLCKQNPTIPRDLELICLRCLEKDPEKRYPTAEALAEDLEAYLRRDPIEARPSGVFSKLRRWTRREPALVSRLAGLVVTAGIVHVRYFFTHDVSPFEHYRIMTLFFLCGLMAFLFQRMMHHESLAEPARYGWAASDVFFLTCLLALADLPIGPVLIGYPLLIAAAGLFFMVRLVFFTTALSLLSFGVLFWMQQPEIMTKERPHYLLIFAGVLAVHGLITAHQVYRVRALSRYYEQRRV